jgi:hypothetical protein
LTFQVLGEKFLESFVSLFQSNTLPVEAACKGTANFLTFATAVENKFRGLLKWRG